jgi:alpha-tubulin suppressor-like RCC1 family protein
MAALAQGFDRHLIVAVLLTGGCELLVTDPDSLPSQTEASTSGSGGEAGASDGEAAGTAGTKGGADTAGAGEPGGSGGARGPVVSQIVAGADHSCAIVRDGKALCWGRNQYGQLGDGTTANRLAPAAVVQAPGGPPLAGVQALALGASHSCARLSEGEVRCWGFNGEGQVGDGTVTIEPPHGKLTPVPVARSPGGPPLTGVEALALGASHSCARLSEGEVRCWGDNAFGQLGEAAATVEALAPVAVVQAPGGPPLTGVRALALGFSHSCAGLSGGEVRCWGDNAGGQLGDSTATVQLAPVAVMQAPGGPPLAGVRALALGIAHSCALLDGGEARCWGRNSLGQLGDGTTTDRLTPVPVLQSQLGLPLTNVRAISVSYSHSCALLEGGEVRCWGDNSSGQLGDGTTTGRLAPVAVAQSPGGPSLTGVEALALGGSHSCALLGGGEVRCWGGNGVGQLGDGTTTDRLYPLPALIPSAP